MDIKVIKDRILVHKEDAVQKGSFVVDSYNTETQYKGKVLQVGRGTKDESMEVKIGDTVIFHKNGCYRIEVEDEEYYVLTQSQVIAILN